MTEGPRDRVRDVLVIGWYPGADDPIAGRFIADQAAALAASGRVRPLVVSWEPFVLHGHRFMRADTARTWTAAVAAAARDGLIPTPSGAAAPAGIPVARLGTPEGRTPTVGRDSKAAHREQTLRAALLGMARPVDLIHAHVGYPDGAAAARVADSLGVPLVLTEHASFLAGILADPVLRERYREAGMAARRIIAVGKGLADQIRAELPELADRLIVIPNLVDMDVFPLVGPDDRRGDELLWVGYRNEHKGMDLLLRAFARVRAARPATTLRLVGRSATAEKEREWQALAAELGVASAVSFDPPTDRAGVAAAVSRAGVFVHPSTRETFGVVAVEALASGLPVVATDSGGVTDVLGDDPDNVGALVPVGDPEALASALVRVLDRRTTFDPRVLRAHVERRYGATVVATRIADLYDEVIGEAGAKQPGAAPDPVRRARSRAAVKDHGAGPGRPPDPSRPVLVAFDRKALDRVLARSPAWLFDGLVVVTRGGVVPGVAATISLDPALEAKLDAILSSVGLGNPFRSPARWIRRLALRTVVTGQVMRALAAAVASGIDLATSGGPPGRGSARQAGGPDAAPPLLVCLGGIDVYAVRRAVGAGRARLAPGGLRWLGDVRWSSAASGEAAAREWPGYAEAASSA